MKILPYRLAERLVRRQSIRFQVLAISLVGILAFVVVAMMLWATQATRSRMQGEMEESWSANLRVVRAGMTFEAARNLGDAFLAERQPGLLVREKETFDRTEHLLEQALREETRPEIAAGMSEVLRLMGIHQRDFTQTAATMEQIGLTQTEGLQGRMRESVHGVEATLEELVAASGTSSTRLLRLQVAMLQMRRAEKDFMLRGDAAYAAAMGGHAAAFSEALDASGLPKAKRDQLADGIRAYQRSFRDLSDVLSELPNQLEQLRGLADRLSPTLEELVRHMDASRATQAERTAAIERTVLQIQSAGMAAAGLLTAALGLLIGRTIARRVTRLAAAMRVLASGQHEAARAGDAGRGFAVVACEVKTLAAQSAQATDDIARRVAGIRAATEAAVRDMRAMTNAIGRVDEIAAIIAAAVEEQGAATQEIAASVQDVSQMTARASAAMADVAMIAQRSGDSSRGVLTTAGEVADVANVLRHEVDAFVTAMDGSDDECRLAETG